MRSQIATSNIETETISLKGGRRYLPYAFTEQGIAMLSAVLRSDEAIQMSVNIMNLPDWRRKDYFRHFATIRNWSRRWKQLNDGIIGQRFGRAGVKRPFYSTANEYNRN